MATNFFCKNDQVIELHFSYDTFKKLPANALSAIYKHFHFDKAKKAWVGKSTNGVIIQQQIALSVGLSFETNGAPAPTAITKPAAISRPQVKFAQLPEPVNYPEPPEENHAPGRAIERLSTKDLITNFENEKGSRYD